MQHHIFNFDNYQLGLEIPRTFHAEWLLDGWNDHVIQPARDAVLSYYKVCVSIAVLFRQNSHSNTLNAIFFFSDTRSHLVLKNICASITYVSSTLQTNCNYPKRRWRIMYIQKKINLRMFETPNVSAYMVIFYMSVVNETWPQSQHVGCERSWAFFA